MRFVGNTKEYLQLAIVESHNCEVLTETFESAGYLTNFYLPVLIALGNAIGPIRSQNIDLVGPLNLSD